MHNYFCPFLRRLLWIGLFFACGLFGTSQAQAKNCLRFFRSGKLKKAGECFRKQADDMGESAKLPPMTRYRKGRLMLNAARIYSRAAKMAKSKDEQESLYTTSLVLYRRYLAEELFEGDVRKQEVLEEIKKVEALIPKQTGPTLPPVSAPQTFETGKVKLTILSGNPKAQICISQENESRRCKMGASWTVQRTPGPYLLQVQYPKSSSQVRLFRLKKGQAATYAFSPPFGETPVDIVAQSDKVLLRLEGGSLLEPLEKRAKRWEIQLPPGQYRLHVAYPKATAYQRLFQVTQGDAVKIECPLPSAKIAFSSTPPGAHLFINDLYSGKTPSKLAMPGGSFLIKVKHPCYRTIERRIMVFEGRHQMVPFFLEKDVQSQAWLQKKQRGRVPPAVVMATFFGGLGLVGFGGLGYGLGASMHQNAYRQRRLYENAQTNMEAYATAYAADARAGNSWITLGHLSTFLGLTAMGVGTYLFVRERPDVEQINPCELSPSPPGSSLKSPAKR